jgi:hypothetical protein
MDNQPLVIGKDISYPVAATAILAQNGLSPNEQAKAFGITRGAINFRLKKLPANIDLTSKKRVRAAVKAVDSFVAGKAFGDIEKLKDSTVLNAAAMVLDRHQPLRSQDSGSVTNYTQVNINVYK